MELVDFSQSAWSLLPAALAISLAILTRHVLFSLGAGIVLGALMLTGFNPLDTAQYLGSNILSLFWDEGALNSWNVYILLFLLILGVMTSFISMAGGSRAFGEWARQRIRTARGAQLMTVGLGLLIFIDDYFNSLAVGNISRPVTDRQNISRAKLAYLIDSTAAPTCVIAPVSSWGAYIIALIGTILAAHSVTEYSALGAFVQMIPLNFYALFALLMVIAIAWLNWDIGPMKTHQQQARAGQLYDHGKGLPPGTTPDLPESEQGHVSDLVLPILVLIVATVGAMLWTGQQALAADDKPFSLLGAFENTDVAASLLYGGLIGLGFTLLQFSRKGLPGSYYAKGFSSGIRAMLPAIYILLFAWAIIKVIGAMHTGKYLAGLVDGTIEAAYLPMLLFILAGAMAFATGTSWGTFGIMLPIAGDIAAATDIAMLLPMLAAVLAGSVFGDHCSPISDTTILSSTGAGSHHIDHVLTQLPYTLLVAMVSIAGYLALGLTQSISISLLVAALSFGFSLLLIRLLAIDSVQDNASALKARND